MPRASTRATLRKAYRAAGLPEYPSLEQRRALLEEAVTEANSFVDWRPGNAAEGEADLGAAIFTDLRPSESRRLSELLADARRLAVDDCMRAIEGRIVDALATFADEHPDAHKPEG